MNFGYSPTYNIFSYLNKIDPDIFYGDKEFQILPYLDSLPGNDGVGLTKNNIYIDSGSQSNILLRPEHQGYVQSAQQLAKIIPTVVLIDGKKRKECASEVAEYLNNHEESQSLWMVILDNSDWFGSSYSILQNCEDFIGFDFYGHGPYNSYSWCTSIFVRINSDYLRKKMNQAGVAKPMKNGILSNWSPDK
jgi:hypothetical protein